MWITQWKFQPRFDLHWWVVGIIVSEWEVTLCLGPVGLSLRKSEIHV